MRVVHRNVYVGPNRWANFPVIQITLDLGVLEEWPSARLGEPFVSALLAALPELHQHGCSYGEPGGFVRRLREDEGTWMGHVLEHVAIELQNMAGAEVTYGRTRSAGEPGWYLVVYDYEQEEVGLEACRVGIELLTSLLPPELRSPEWTRDGYDWEEERTAFIRFAQRRALGPSTVALVRAAEARDVPWLRLNRYSLIQFGHGHLQKRIQATITGETRHIAVELASDKEETNRILSDIGLPVPRQQLVYTPDEAVRAARRIGYPVVVKPLDANHGRGVSIGLVDDDGVRNAFEVARGHARTVLVESFITGFDHRLLVVDGELIAAAKRVPGHVVGDGRSTIGELVERVNEDPQRGVGHEKVLTRLGIDHQARRLMTQAGYDETTVLPTGDVFYLRSTGNLSTGGTAVDVTDLVHPDNRRMAMRASRAIGLDVAGIDFLTTDIARSWNETGGAICEVNAAPGFRMHVSPSEGTPRDAAGPVIDMLFPPGTPSRIPIASITGTNGKTTVARMTAHLFKMAGKRVGLASTDGVYVDGHRTVEGDMTGPTAARMVLRDPAVEVAVLETARGGLLRSGMGYRRCNVGTVLNVQSDHLGLRGVDSLEELAEIKRIVVEVARDAAVLNADDELCLKMADHTQAERICYVTMNPKHTLVREHILAGGRAVVLEEGIKGQMITLYQGPTHAPLLWTHLIPATLEGRALHNVQNAMFAAAIGSNMGLSHDDIRHGLRTFDTTFFQAPGRMNVYDEHPFKVILDYGHNPAAIQAMVRLVDRLEPRGRRIVVLAAPGDRRDEDVRDSATTCAGHFDRYILRRDDHLRGRQPDEVPRLQRDALLAAGVPEEAVEVIPDEQAAVARALDLSRESDLLLVFGDHISRCWKQITTFQPAAGAPGAEPATVHGGYDQPPPEPEIVVSHLDDLIRDERGVRLPRELDD
ncbi:MAG TPA: cyanophycin synthetase [Thermoanaerobaculia bacterium]|nr:cyanophycin synthetase [Thermoanaerobaculia bacterium]